MLAVPHTLSPPELQGRGRSRQISHAALARQASDQRRTDAAASIIHGRLYACATQSLLQQPIAPKSPPPSAPRIIITAPPEPSETSASPPLSSSSSSSPPTSLSPDSFDDSPPSPPRTLEDQVHIAYALDDIHLAKVLLLKLKGIEVTSDDDPRIAQVQDEDFDMCFVPTGRLLNEDDEKAVLECQEKERERLDERTRVQRLRDCERIWSDEKRRLREEKKAALMKKEEEERRRVQEEAEEQKRKAEAAANEERSRARARPRSRAPPLVGPPRIVVSYEGLSHHRGPPPSPEDKESPFVYDFMPPTPTSSRRTPRPPSKSRPQPHHSRCPKDRELDPEPSPSDNINDDSRSVPFKEVLASMQGLLFPIERDEQRHLSTSIDALSFSSVRLNRGKNELLDALLKVVEWEEGERQRRKGKRKVFDRTRCITSTISTTATTTTCVACSAVSKPPKATPIPIPSLSVRNVSASPLSRAGSWLSFGSYTSRSPLASDARTPSTSPKSISNWLRPPSSDRRRSRSRLRATSTSPPRSQTPAPLRHSCHRTRPRLVPISPCEGPLHMTPPPPMPSIKEESFFLKPPSENSLTVPRRSRKLSVSGSVTRILDIAKGLHTAYLSATRFTVLISPSFDPFEDRVFTGFAPVGRGGGAFGAGAMFAARYGSDGRTRPRPQGYRVRAPDVAAFLGGSAASLAAAPSADTAAASLDGGTEPLPKPVYIPLVAPYSVSHPPRTTLPSPLPYPIVFKPQVPLTKSPSSSALGGAGSAHAQGRGGGLGNGKVRAVTWRPRIVGNPVYLRLKALQNIVWQRGVNWEGRGREGSLSSGKEKVLVLAFEGIGRSWLGVTGEGGGAYVGRAVVG